MLKILQTALQQYLNQELSDVQVGFRKHRGTTDQIVSVCWIIEKAREFQENIFFCFIVQKPLTVWLTTNCGKFLKMGIPDHLTCLLRNLYAGQGATVRTLYGTTDWFKIGKGILKAVYCHPVYLTYMQTTSYEMPVWMSYKLESRLPGEMSATSDMHSISGIY